MMRFEISNEIRLIGCPPALYVELTNLFTLANPKALEAERMGRWFDPDEQYLYFWRREGNALVLPRGAAQPIMAMAKQYGRVEIDDRRLKLPPCGYSFRGQLRPYQVQAVQAILGREFGVLEAGTGSGKTVMALAIIASRQQPTLVLVHTKELLYQWRDRIKTFLGIEAGLIGDGHLDIRLVSVGIVNTVRKQLDSLVERFGQVVVDECHRVPSTLFSEALRAFPAHYMLGLSATPYRRDGLDKLIAWHCGEHRAKVERTVLHEVGAVLRPKVHTVETGFNYWYSDDYQDLVSTLVQDESRNRLIAGCIDRVAGHGQVLVTSDRVEHLKALAELSGHGEEAILTGKTPKKKRRAMVELIRTGELPVVFSTLSLIGEGFDAAGLSALVLASPVRYKGRLQQTVGRVLRPQGGKQPLVIDFRDSKVGVLDYQWKTRQREFRAMGAKFDT
ncbi:MAG: DEAD/DEAH box helicase [Desulfobulbus sp.]|jgi:superfamily II DNA or RNA helicase